MVAVAKLEERKMFTRQHFEFVAAVLHSQRPVFDEKLESPAQDIQLTVWNSVAREFARRFEDANPRFNTYLFWQDCQIGVR